MKIEVADYLTLAQVGEHLGSNLRAATRAIARCEAEGLVVKEIILGRKVVHRSKLPIIKDHYFPYYSDAHQKMVEKWGAMGGAAKARNNRAKKALSGETPAEPMPKRPRGRPRKHPRPGESASTSAHASSGTSGKAT